MISPRSPREVPPLSARSWQPDFPTMTLGPGRERLYKVATLEEGWMAEVKPQEISAMSFEEALAELELIVRRLESGNGKLDDAIASYERGASLKRHCEGKLREAQMRIDRIVLAADGTPKLERSEIE